MPRSPASPKPPVGLVAEEAWVVDLALVADAERMRELLDAPAWDVLVRYLKNLQADALQHLTNPARTDQEMHHWRGVYVGTQKVVGLPVEIIAYEKAQRA